MALFMSSLNTFSQDISFKLFVIGRDKTESIYVYANDSLYIFNFDKKQNWSKGKINVGYINVRIEQNIDDGDIVPININRKSGCQIKSAGVDNIRYIDCSPKYLFILRSHYVKKKYGYTYHWANSQIIDGVYHLSDYLEYCKPDSVISQNKLFNTSDN